MLRPCILSPAPLWGATRPRAWVDAAHPDAWSVHAQVGRDMCVGQTRPSRNRMRIACAACTVHVRRRVNTRQRGTRAPPTHKGGPSAQMSVRMRSGRRTRGTAARLGHRVGDSCAERAHEQCVRRRHSYTAQTGTTGVVYDQARARTRQAGCARPRTHRNACNPSRTSPWRERRTAHALSSTSAPAAPAANPTRARAARGSSSVCACTLKKPGKRRQGTATAMPSKQRARRVIAASTSTATYADAQAR